ncbi:hypothetical protein MPSEU_000110300 [Mayamaea pseudoterrestris]|nr:hypothetical protein MPSEU_000110300 [Mayamaea pseudoterrestris]
MLRVTPIYGSRWSPQGQAEEPSCTLVEYSGVRILWNCGYKPDFPTSLPKHDALIISDSSLAAAGGLPQYYSYMMKQNEQQQHMQVDDERNASHSQAANLSLPKIYATFPTVKMGQMTLYDLHASICLDGGCPAFSLQDIDGVFASIQSIKYSQPIVVVAANNLKDPLSSTITVVAHRAGHLVGAAFFNLHRYRDETLVVLTTSRYQIAKELHLDGSTLLQDGSSPDVLVCSPGGVNMRYLRTLAHTSSSGGKVGAASSAATSLLPTLMVTQAERNLTETVMSTLRRDGNVLLPVDAAGRVLELVLLLNRHWERQRLTSTYNLVWFAPMVYNTLDYARSQLEWMAMQLGTEFDSMNAGHPYQLRAVQVCTSMRQLEQVLANQNPSCVLASGLSLEGGPARDVFLKWAENPDNAIIFTDSSQCYLRTTWEGTSAITETTADQVMMEANQQQLTSATTSSTMVGSTTAASGPVPIELDPEDTEDHEATGGVGRQTLVGNAVDQMSEWTTAGQLLFAWAQAKLEGREMEDFVPIDVKVPRRVPLVGAELNAFLASEEKARQLLLQEEEASAMLREIELAKGELRLGEQEGATLAVVEPTANANNKSRPQKKSRFDSSLFFKFSKPLHLMFDVHEDPVGIGQDESVTKSGIGESMGRSAETLEDDYGIAVVPELFTDIVSGVDSSKFGTGRIGDEVLRRGLGYGVDGASGKGKALAGVNGRLVSDVDDHDDFDELDEDALEAVDLSEGHGIIRGRNGQPPAKVTTVVRKVEVQAEISFVPLEGRVDARAARQSVRALQPRRVVVLGGPCTGERHDTLVDEVSLLAEAATSFVTDDEPILVPSDGESVELNIGHAAYAVRVIDNPYQTREEKASNVPPPQLPEPFEAKLGGCTVSLLDSVATGQKVAADGSIVLAPRAKLVDEMPSLYLSDGEVLLTDLRTELIAAGMKAEYSTHQGYAQLIINQRIIVKKAVASGRFEIEGPLCEDFYTVRAFVCGQFVIL